MSESTKVIFPLLGNNRIHGILTKSKVADQHGWATQRLVEWVGIIGSGSERLELVSTSGALDESPFIVEQALEEAWRDTMSVLILLVGLDGTYCCPTWWASWTR